MSHEGISITLLSNIIESQIANSEYWLKSKDRSIKYIINLAEHFRAKCEVLENELMIANKRIKVLEKHVEQYTKAHTDWTDFSDEAPI